MVFINRAKNARSHISVFYLRWNRYNFSFILIRDLLRIYTLFDFFRRSGVVSSPET